MCDLWREIKQRESEHVPVEYRHMTVYGVADRNIECWLAADRDYLAQRLAISQNALDVDDPKGILERANSKITRSPTSENSHKHESP